MTNSNSSMFRQRSGPLPTVNQNKPAAGGGGGRYNFSNLNDDSDEEEDNAYAFDAQAKPTQAAHHSANNNSNAMRKSHSFEDENSVASENLSVGNNSAGEDSFSMDH
jgi:hypothetical protein